VQSRRDLTAASLTRAVTDSVFAIAEVNPYCGMFVCLFFVAAVYLGTTSSDVFMLCLIYLYCAKQDGMQLILLLHKSCMY
jgi:hypothetical protein